MNGNYGGAVFFGVDATSTCTLTNCLFYKINLATAANYGEGAIVAMNSSSTLNIMNCTITDCGNTTYGTGGVLTLSSAKINLTNTIIYNNIGTAYPDVYNNTGTIVMKNCCYTSGSNKVKSITTNTSALVANPLFTNSATDDYTLQSSSPCVDYGTLTGAPTDDIRHYSRVANPDVGCYESNGTSLPIELLMFDATCIDNNIIVNWTTASETNNQYFVVEKTDDPSLESHWKIVAISNGAGNSVSILNYSINDLNDGFNYYRLKQIDFDGKYAYSNIVYLNGCESNGSIKIYPTLSSGEIFINVKSVKNDNLSIVVVDGIGQVIYNQSSMFYIGESIKNINIREKGIYFINVYNEHIHITNKVVVE